ncbi:MAG: hypothetical protein SCALA702_20170 [Melioribacteraceae bacterium]|nr:MAG: hypothetical protein SCALA702_20170 [Melioribacteraceae bacterium]
MKNKFSGLMLLFLFIGAGIIQAQFGVDQSLRRIGFHTGNRVGISFYNDGQIAGFNTGTDIRGEWPLGSGYNYIGDLVPLIAVEFNTVEGDTNQSVIISRGPRNRQSLEKHPVFGYFWGWNAEPGFLNPNGESVAMSHLPDSWPIGGWADPGGFPEVPNYLDEQGNTEWWGYFGRGIINADQESFFVAFDQSDDEFNIIDDNNNVIGGFIPDTTDLLRHGMGLQLRQRGFQWASFLAEDVIFWLYDIKNEGTYTFKKANFGTVVGTLAGGDGDSGDDLGFFDSQDWITYSWDSDNSGNRGQEVGYVGYAFLESPGNPFDGIDNDGDADEMNVEIFASADFEEKTYNAGDKIVLIDETTYERTWFTIGANTDTILYSLGKAFQVFPGMTVREGHIAGTTQGVNIPDVTAVDGFDNDLDGVIDENEAIHFEARVINQQTPLKYHNYFNSLTPTNLLVDERRDNDIDEDGDWDINFDDIGVDGLGPEDTGYPGPDFGEGDGVPTQGEPNFGRTDPDESDQIGLTAFNFFNISAAPELDNDADLWVRMTPGRFDVVPARPQDGDFIYSSGFFPLPSANEALGISGVERFSVALLFGEDQQDIFSNKEVVQQIYNAGYKFPQPPPKPQVTLAQEDGNVVVYWDGSLSENVRDFITKENDFQGYKIYRATDAGFADARQITNANGVLTFDKPIAQYDIDDDISGYFYPTEGLLAQVGGTTYYLGDNTGVVNKFVDSTVVPGQTYYYAVVSYDHGNDSLGIFPSENSKFIFRENTGDIATDDNTGYITPGLRPAGYLPPENTEFVKSDTYRATGSFAIELVDDASVKDNYEYQVQFTDTTLASLTESWSLIDLQRPDSVYIPMINETYIVDPLDSVQIPAGEDTIFVNGYKYAVTSDYYTAPYDTLVNKATKFAGETPIVDGFRMQFLNDWSVKIDSANSGWEGVDQDPAPPYTVSIFYYGPNLPKRLYNGVGVPNDYEIEFFDSIVDTSVIDSLNRIGPLYDVFLPQEVNFKVKNVTTGKYIDFIYFTSGSISTTHVIRFKENIDGQIIRTWQINIDYGTTGAPLPTAGTFSLYTKKPFSSKDSFTFSMKGASIDNDLAKTELDLIKVVPNPYVVTHAAEARLLSSQTSGRGEREIRFTKIPPGSKISIFTVRGDLIATLNQEDLYVGDVFWNLRTDENLDVAFGVYVYVVETPESGTKIGKFALIK